MPCCGAPAGGIRCVSTRCLAPARCAMAPRSDAVLCRRKTGGGMPLSRSGPITGWIVECTITSAPLASNSTCAEVEASRGGAGLSLLASPPITTLPAGVSTRYEACPAMCVERIALTLTSPEDHTACGSFEGVNTTTFAIAAGPPSARRLSSDRRWAISPASLAASAICATNRLQLTVKPSGLALSSLHTTSIFGPVGKTIQRCWSSSIRPSLWSLCRWVRKTALICPDCRPTCAQDGAAADVELQPHGVAVGGIVAVADERARPGLPLIGLRSTLRAGHGHRQAGRRLRHRHRNEQQQSRCRRRSNVHRRPPVSQPPARHCTQRVRYYHILVFRWLTWQTLSDIYASDLLGRLLSGLRNIEPPTVTP